MFTTMVLKPKASATNADTNADTNAETPNSEFGPNRLHTQTAKFAAWQSGRSMKDQKLHDAKHAAKHDAPAPNLKDVSALKHTGGKHKGGKHKGGNTFIRDNTDADACIVEDNTDDADADDANDGVQLRNPPLMGDCIQWGEIPSGLTIKEWPRIAGVILSGKLPTWPSAPCKEAVPNA